MSATAMLAFTNKGELVGEPRFAYMTPAGLARTGTALSAQGVAAAIDACTVLPLPETLGRR